MTLPNKQLEAEYVQLLHHGLLIVRDCLANGQSEWAAVEVEHMHNLPSLFREANRMRHEYYFGSERSAYIERLSKLAPEFVCERVKIIYEPIWLRISNLLDT